MALIFIEGFTSCQQSKFTSKGWVSNPNSTTAGRFSGNAGVLGSGNDWMRALPATYTTLIVGAAVKPGGVAQSGLLRFWDSSGNTIATLNMNSSGILYVTNSSGTTIATGTTAAARSGAWLYVEMKIVINGASGSCAVQVNGLSEIATTSGNFGSTAIGRVGFRFDVSGLTEACDDMYVCDTTGAKNNTFLGDVRVETLFPSADGSHTSWTPNSGTAHFSRVNESSSTWPDDDTSYNSDATPGDYDTYQFTDLSLASGTVFGVQTNLYARKDDANTRQIAPVIRQSGTDHDGTTVTLGSGYSYYQQMYENDPTGAAWTITNANADEFGVKMIA